MSFAVVVFSEENSVAVVHQSWVNNGLCAWPAYKGSRLRNAIMRGEKPLETWSIHQARVLDSYATYIEAEGKLAIAEEQSALETESEEMAVPRSQLKRKHVSDVESSSDDSPRLPAEQCAQPPKVKNAGLHLKELPKPPMSLLSKHSARADRCQPSQHAGPAAVESRKGDVRQSGDDVSRGKKPVRPVTSSSEVPTKNASMEKNLVCPPASTMQVSSKGLELLLGKLAVIEAQQRQHTRLLQQVLSALSQEPGDLVELPDDVHLPLDSVEDMDRLDQKLEDRDTAALMIRYLGAFGGKTAADTTRRVMRNLMSNQLALQLNFEGRGHKTGFGNTRLLRLVVGAVKSNRLLGKAASVAEIEETVKLWLRYAGDRGGGRCKRRSKTCTQTPEEQLQFEPDEESVE